MAASGHGIQERESMTLRKYFHWQTCGNLEISFIINLINISEQLSILISWTIFLLKFQHTLKQVQIVALPWHYNSYIAWHEFAKLRAKRAYMPTCLRASVVYVPTCQLLIFTCQRANKRANVPYGVPMFQVFKHPSYEMLREVSTLLLKKHSTLCLTL